MAYMQRRRLTTFNALDTQATWRYKLPSVGKFTGIEIQLGCNRYAANHADADVNYPLETQVTRVELLRQATRPIISLTGKQLDALNYWDFKRPNPRRHRYKSEMDNQLTLFLLAGRHLWDREYGYDFSKLGETYLEFTHALTEDVVEKFDVSTSVITLYAWQWMGPGQPNFKGYFRTRQLDYWTTSAANTVHAVPIPVGNPLRRIGLQIDTRAYTIGGGIKEIELVVNDGEYSPVHIKSPMHWTMAEVQEYGLYNELGGLDYLVEGEVTDLPYWFGYYEDVHVENYVDVAGHAVMWGLITCPPRAHAHAAYAAEIKFSEKGWGFQKCLRIGFDHEYDGFDLLPTAGLGALDLICTETAGSVAVRTFVQDVIRY